MSSITLEGKDFKDYLTLKEKHNNEIAAKNQEISKLNEDLEGVISEKYQEVGHYIRHNPNKAIFYTRQAANDLINLKSENEYIRNKNNDSLKSHKRIVEGHEQTIKKLKNRTLIQRIFRKYE